MRVSLEVFNAIINACTANLLTFYAPYVVSSLQEWIKQEKKLFTTLTPASNLTLYTQILDLKLLATDTVRKRNLEFH